MTPPSKPPLPPRPTLHPFPAHAHPVTLNLPAHPPSLHAHVTSSPMPPSTPSPYTTPCLITCHHHQLHLYQLSLTCHSFTWLGPLMSNLTPSVAPPASYTAVTITQVHWKAIFIPLYTLSLHPTPTDEASKWGTVPDRPSIPRSENVSSHYVLTFAKIRSFP